MKTFATRHPVVFSSLLALALFGLTFASKAALPAYVAPSVENLPAELVREPTQGEQAIADLRNAQNLYAVMSALLAVVLLTGLGWWREAGFASPSRMRNPLLLLFPLLVCALSFLGGVGIRGPALFASALLSILITVFAEEALYRGIFWKMLAPKGVVRAMVVTSLLSGALFLVGSSPIAPWPETVYLSVLTFCTGFTYAALRWRTASIWPPILLHFALGLSAEFSTPETIPDLNLLLILTTTLGFVGYGLILLRNPRARADGALTTQAELPRVR